MSKNKKPNEKRINLLFFSGNKYDRSGMVAFADVMGCRTKFFVSKDSAVVPSPTKQRFECIFNGRLESIDRKSKTATAYAKLIRNIPMERIPTFEEKLSLVKTSKPNPDQPTGDLGILGKLLDHVHGEMKDRASKRTKRHKRHTTGTQKGSSEKAAIGAGNSKKSRHARRKRQRLANAA